MKNVITLCCGRPKCPKLTLPVIEGNTYGPKDLFFLSDDYSNECRYDYSELTELELILKHYSEYDKNITHEIRDNNGNECLLTSEECSHLLDTINKLQKQK